MERGFVFAIGLGVMNIVLNTLASKTAEGASSVWVALSRPMFVAAFVAGTGSLALMIGLYTSGYPLARGLLIAGATSIVLGVVWATFQFGNRLEPIEWLLWSAILLFYLARATGLFRGDAA